MVANSTATTWATATSESGFSAYWGRSRVRAASSGWVALMTSRAILRASSRPS